MSRPRALDDPAALARAARIVREALARQQAQRERDGDSVAAHSVGDVATPPAGGAS